MLAALAAAPLLGACATEQPYVWAAEGGTPAMSLSTTEPEGTVHARDTLLIFVRNQAALSGEFAVREDGAFLVAGVGDVPAAGLSTEQIKADLAFKLKDMLVSPQVSVAILKRAPVRVNVVGEVKTPGIYELGRDRSLLAALAAAGWVTDFAGRDRIFVVRREAPSPRLRFRVRELTSPTPSVAAFSLRDGDVVSVE
jgi:polysaccharide export outer membrane protein